MKILYGTTNKGKLQAMEKSVEQLEIEIIGLNDLNAELPTINESGKTPLENAEIKARTYFEAFHMPVFSCDSGLYFEELAEDEQPGIYVRRINGKELDDAEMIQYYASLAEKYGGRITGRYRNAIYFILDEEHHYSSMDMSIATEPFILVAKPHDKRVEGFPLDSLSIDIETGEYYYDIDVKDVSTSVDDGVRAFFTKALLLDKLTKMDIQKLTERYEVRKLDEEDIEKVYNLMQGNPLFFRYCPPMASAQSIARDMKALPPRTTYEDKYYLGYFEDGKLIAVMDLILNFPNPDTAFIGFFMVDGDIQGKGVGTEIVCDCFAALKEDGYQYVRLGFAKGNPQSEAFWTKNGFNRTGVENVQELYTVVIMEKQLGSF